MISFLQVNLCRSPAAHDLLDKVAKEKTVSIVLVSEPNKKYVEDDKWYKDKNKASAIRVYDQNLRVKENGVGNGFTWVVIEDMQIFSVYFPPSPNVPVQSLINSLYNLKEEIRKSKCSRFLIGGDVNAKSYTWNSRTEDDRGVILTEWIAEMGMYVLNVGNQPTFIRGASQSILDVTICSRNIFHKVINWRVSDEENLTDHENIYFELNENYLEHEKEDYTVKWKYQGGKEEELKQEIEKKLEEYQVIEDPEICIKVLQDACGKFFGRKAHSKRQGVYWWSKEIAEKRKKCHQQKRKIVRANRNNQKSEEEKEKLRKSYYRLKQDLRFQINKSKKEKWAELCRDLNRDVWGKGYQIVCKKFKLFSRVKLETIEKKEIAEELFPQNQKEIWEKNNIEEDEIPLFTLQEITDA